MISARRFFAIDQIARAIERDERRARMFRRAYVAVRASAGHEAARPWMFAALRIEYDAAVTRTLFFGEGS